MSEAIGGVFGNHERSDWCFPVQRFSPETMSEAIGVLRCSAFRAMSEAIGGAFRAMSHGSGSLTGSPETMSEAIGVFRSAEIPKGAAMIHFPVTPAELLVLPNEDLDAFKQLRAVLHAQYCAATPTELFLVEELVQNAWRIRRFRILEAGAFHSVGGEIRADMRQVTFLQRSLSAAERASHRALTALTKLQQSRTKQASGFVPSKSEPRPARDKAAARSNGFVPQKTASAASDHLDWDEPFDGEAFRAAKEKYLAEQESKANQSTSSGNS